VLAYIYFKDFSGATVPFTENYVPTKRFTWDFSLSSSSLGPSPQVRQALMQALSDNDALSPYPDAGYPELVKAIANFHHVDFDNIILGAGLDGLIFDSINALLGPNDELVIPAVTFRNALYAAASKGAVVKQVPMQATLAVDFEQLIKTIGANTKVVFLCNPNNPTGLYEPLVSIRRLLESTTALVIVDEANIEFTGGESALSLVEQFPHLMVLRTFSKAYGLAGIRVGYGISRSPLLKKIASDRPPFFISKLSEIAACHAFADQDYMHHAVASIIQERSFLECELKNLGFTVTPSRSNTVLCRIPQGVSSASYVIEQLNKYDVNVVNGTHFNLEDRYLRISPKLREANENMLQVLKHILGI